MYLYRDHREYFVHSPIKVSGGAVINSIPIILHMQEIITVITAILLKHV